MKLSKPHDQSTMLAGHDFGHGRMRRRQAKGGRSPGAGELRSPGNRKFRATGDDVADHCDRTTRRSVLRAATMAGAALAAPMFFVRESFAQERFCNIPTGKTAKFGFNVPTSGAYAAEGADQLRAFRLAVKHLNGDGDGGMLATLNPSALTGSGVLGKKVTFAVGNTQTRRRAARASARQLIDEEGVVMLSGGSSSSVAVVQQNLAQDLGVVFMCGLTHANDTTGKDRRRYGFRHFFNAHMSALALAPVIAQTLGSDRRAYHLTADYNWGWSIEDSIKGTTERLGWETAEVVRTPLGAADFSFWLKPVMDTGADVLILNHYGDDMVNSLTQAVQLGMRERVVNGKQFEVVVPLYSELMARGAGQNVSGVLGTSNWNWQLDDPGSAAFTKSFLAEFGQMPSQAAQTCYVQTLLYADAVERAGTFYPPEVIRALEDHEFEGTGGGPTLYRGADHQCFQNVLVVRGRDNPTGDDDLLEIVRVAPRQEITYPADLFPGELGPYGANGCAP